MAKKPVPLKKERSVSAPKQREYNIVDLHKHQEKKVTSVVNNNIACENSITRMKHAQYEKDIVRTMRERGISRKRAAKIVKKPKLSCIKEMNKDLHQQIDVITGFPSKTPREPELPEFHFGVRQGDQGQSECMED